MSSTPLGKVAESSIKLILVQNEYEDTETDHLAPPDSWNQKMFLARGGRTNKLKQEKPLK